ncbi:MAG: methyltransferase domain-containing protein [Proteobacteria bacterium]|nr:methyltransferase domain-containing protein [Pseudomonadota bacterium]
MFRQQSLISVTGYTLRPGGFSLTQNAVDVCGFDRDDQILDAGCGYGMTGRYLFEEYGIRAMATDVAEDMVRRTRLKHTATPGWDAGIVQSRIPALPFRSGTFNGIFCECVLSLIPDKKTCLDEFFRILKKNGRLVLTDLYIPERYKNLAAQNTTGTQEIRSCLDGAVTLMSLIRLVESAGFTVEMIEDHTQYLKQMAGQMVFEHGSLNNFWDTVSGTLCNTRVSSACKAGQLKPGYYMMIAARYE